MNRDEFLEAMLDVLDRDDELSFDMELEDIDEWDSLSIMATMAFLKKQFGLQTSVQDFKKMKTIEDIAVLAGL